MNRWIKKTLIIGLAIGLGEASASANLLDLKKQDQIPVSLNSVLKPAPVAQSIHPDTGYNTEVANKNISLRFENLSLIKILQNIQEETGISFSIDPKMETVSFSATVQAENWEAAIKELLKDFSRIEVWTENLNTSRVWLYQGR